VIGARHLPEEDHMLSDKAVDQLIAAPIATYGQDNAHRRAAAREAVAGAAEELGLDPKKPPLPKFGAGEDTLAAAVRVLKLDTASKALEKYRGQRAPCVELEQHFETLKRRRDELRIVELNRLREELTRGRIPAPASEKLRAELDAIRTELDTVGGYDVGLLVPQRPDAAVLSEAITEPEWLGVTFYIHLVSERLLSLTSGEPNTSRARMLARTANTVAASYERTVNNAPARFAPEHDQAIRSIRWCVETADLHGIRASDQRRRERELEELIAAEPADVRA
jgi:hypothetical protein